MSRFPITEVSVRERLRARIENIRSQPPSALFHSGSFHGALLVPNAVVTAPIERPRYVAMVGTRKASGVGLTLANELAHALAGTGAVIVSGGALGIDSASHEGALAGGGHTIAVLPCSLHTTYPPSNAELFARIQTSGCLLSEYAHDEPSGKFQFVARNDWIAALADVVVVVEAGAHSGALYTAEAARKAGVPVAAFPWSVRHSEGVGCNQLLRDGATLVRDADDVWRILLSPPGIVPTLIRRKKTRRMHNPSTQQVELAALRETQANITRTGDERNVLRHLAAGPMHIDALTRATDLSAAKIQLALFELEADGEIELSGVSWRCAK